LGKLGYKRVILSNIDRGTLKETIRKNSLDVDGYITAEDVGSYKPSFGHWNRFYEMYKVSKERTLHVAQSIYHDIIPCSKLAISTAWINRYSETNPLSVNPTYVFDDLRSLLTLPSQNMCMPNSHTDQERLFGSIFDSFHSSLRP
jgi:FMN phosphatase YigB (HAD superfamily)